MLVAVAVAVSVPAATAIGRAQDRPRVNQDALLIEEFTKRVQDYVELHRKLERTLPDLPDKPTSVELDTHERAMARLITQARARAQQGDIFTKAVRAFFGRQLLRALAGPDGNDIRNEIMDDNPGRIQLRVNSRYPDEIPLATTPLQILAELPKLPDELEYRFIGQRLILLDAHARLVVDYIEDGLPK
jgi:hypothetical protein